MMFAVFDVFVSYYSTLNTSLARIQGFSLMVTTHNSTALKVNGMTEDILFLVLLGQKTFCIQSQDTKSPMFTPTISLFLFPHPQEHTNSTTLMGTKQWVGALF